MHDVLFVHRAFLLFAAGTLAATTGGCGSRGSSGSGGGGTTSTASGVGGATVTSSSVGTTGAGGADAGCAGGAQACRGTPDCPTPAVCTSATCYLGCCGTYNLPAETPCNSNGGLYCSGLGQCVACVVGSDCPAQLTLCVINTCTGNVCGTVSTAPGTPCADSGGVTCDGAGHCVASSDGGA